MKLSGIKKLREKKPVMNHGNKAGKVLQNYWGTFLITFALYSSTVVKQQTTTHEKKGIPF